MAQKQTFWEDKNGKFVVWQRPNILLATWFLALALSIVLPDNAASRFISMISGFAILIWAVLELIWGVNYFRRLLGLCVLLLILVAHFI